jgi:hypothetical protein
MSTYITLVTRYPEGHIQAYTIPQTRQSIMRPHHPRTGESSLSYAEEDFTLNSRCSPLLVLIDRRVVCRWSTRLC